jgi:sec-independent protein translocase protein TatC
MATSDSAEMPFLDHLEELRWRIIWSLLALVIGVAVGFIVVLHFDVIAVLERPIAPLLHGKKLVFTHPSDPFSLVMKMAFAIGIIIALPVIIYQAWAFLSPALYQHEKKVVIPVIAGAVALFLAGVCLSYFVIMPVTLQFLIGIGQGSLEQMISATEYFDFALTMSLAFGASFELPILVLALTALGIVTPQFLAKYRRHAVVLVVVAAAIITPGTDITSLVTLSIPLYLLYELSILLSRLVFRKRARAAAAEADDSLGDAEPRSPMRLLDVS